MWSIDRLTISERLSDTLLLCVIPIHKCVCVYAYKNPYTQAFAPPPPNENPPINSNHTQMAFISVCLFIYSHARARASSVRFVPDSARIRVLLRGHSRALLLSRSLLAHCRRGYALSLSLSFSSDYASERALCGSRVVLKLARASSVHGVRTIFVARNASALLVPQSDGTF